MIFRKYKKFREAKEITQEDKDEVKDLKDNSKRIVEIGRKSVNWERIEEINAFVILENS